ncbi:MAG: cytochrome c oxidase subunit II [Acidimicrobiia bacterium]
MRRLPARWRLVVASAAAIVVGGCDLPTFFAPDARSEQGESVLSLWQGFFLIALGVGALVYGLIIYSLVRYRRRTNDLPYQGAYNIPVEIVYTVTPILVVAALFGVTVAVEVDTTETTDDPEARIEVTGFQWSWRFTYPDEGVSIVGTPEEPPEMVIPVGVPTQLELVSSDVNHSFWVPDFLTKRDLIPGVDNTIDVTPTEEDTYIGRCAEFCGLDHWRMLFTVRVVPEEEYRAWLDEQRAQQGDGQDLQQTSGQGTGRTVAGASRP